MEITPIRKEAYDAQAPEFELARELMAARMVTTQKVLAGIESGRGTPSMRTVQRSASAVVRMEPLTAA